MQKITPFLWFDNQAEEAVKFYCSIFPNAKIGKLSAFVSSFELEGLHFTALNGGPHYKFSGAISLYVNCETQAEVDDYWDKLSDGGSIQMCGWLKDKFGLSWQIIPSALPKLMSDPDRDKANRVMQAMLQMKKIDTAELERAYSMA
jgi:predicted 3-demethylubiquinone-9 3-methyltransferase (glyoxalase superfamily)